MYGIYNAESQDETFKLEATATGEAAIMSFYMTLPSDGSLETFPNNTLSSFRTHLPQMMDLDEGEWEVGLSEIVYPTTVENVKPGGNYMEIIVPSYFRGRSVDPSPSERFKVKKMTNLVPFSAAERPDILFPIANPSYSIPVVGVTYRVEIMTGFYSSVDGVLAELNHVLTDGFGDILKGLVPENDPKYRHLEFKYLKTFNRVQFSVSGPEHETKYIYPVRLSPALSHMLGFTIDEDPSWMTKTTYAVVTPDLYIGMSALYLYNNVTRSQIVGSKNLQLLRIVPFKHQGTDTATTDSHGHWEPRLVEYIPLAKTHFDTLDIHIYDGLGERVSFFNGKVIVKLHFRHKRYI